MRKHFILSLDFLLHKIKIRKKNFFIFLRTKEKLFKYIILYILSLKKKVFLFYFFLFLPFIRT